MPNWPMRWPLPLLVMGVKAGLNLINQMKNLACIFIDDQNRIYTSGNIPDKRYLKL